MNQPRGRLALLISAGTSTGTGTDLNFDRFLVTRR